MKTFRIILLFLLLNVSVYGTDCDDEECLNKRREHILESFFVENTLPQIKAYVEPKIKKQCFVSRAWPRAGAGSDIDKELMDWQLKIIGFLELSGIKIVYDEKFLETGALIESFAKKIKQIGFVLVLFTPGYKEKAEDVTAKNWVSIELSFVEERLSKRSKKKYDDFYIPVLLSGEPAHSIPTSLHKRLYIEMVKRESGLRERKTHSPGTKECCNGILRILQERICKGKSSILEALGKIKDEFDCFSADCLSGRKDDDLRSPIADVVKRWDESRSIPSGAVATRKGTLKRGKPSSTVSDTFLPVALLFEPAKKDLLSMNIPDLEFFIDRYYPEEAQSYLLSLRNQLARGPVVLTGMIGAGKTKLALGYAWNAAKEGCHNLIWRIRCDTPDTLKEDYGSLAKHLGITSETEFITALKRSLSAGYEGKPWLLVYDNAPSEDFLRDIIPQVGGHVLISSRDNRWSFPVLSLGGFQPAEAVSYLLKKTRSMSSAIDSEVLRVAELFDLLPLALSRVASYIIETDSDFSSFEKDFQKKPTEFFDYKPDRGLSITELLQSSIGATCVEILRTAVNTSGHAKNLLTFADYSLRAIAIRDGSARAELKRYSLTQVSRKEMVTIPRLVQLFISLQYPVLTEDAGRITDVKKEALDRMELGAIKRCKSC